jgi:hypothetical protein
MMDNFEAVLKKLKAVREEVEAVEKKVEAVQTKVEAIKKKLKEDKEDALEIELLQRRLVQLRRRLWQVGDQEFWLIAELARLRPDTGSPSVRPAIRARAHSCAPSAVPRADQRSVHPPALPFCTHHRTFTASLTVQLSTSMIVLKPRESLLSTNCCHHALVGVAWPPCPWQRPAACAWQQLRWPQREPPRPHSGSPGSTPQRSLRATPGGSLLSSTHWHSRSPLAP